jgi:uncharacterized membrane protein
MNEKRSLFQRAFSKLKNWLLAGLILWIPILVTFYILLFVFSMLNNVFDNLPPHLQPQTLIGNLIPYFKDREFPGLGLILSLTILALSGVFVTNYIGKKILKTTEKKILERIPLVKTIYKAIKQISNAILSNSNKSFQRVLMIEYPRKGLYSLAFQTSEPFLDSLTQKKLVTVFIPTTPNPTSGFIILVPEEDTKKLNIPVEEALQFIISLGVVTPANFQLTNTNEQTKQIP